MILFKEQSAVGNLPLFQLTNSYDMVYKTGRTGLIHLKRVFVFSFCATVVMIMRFPVTPGMTHASVVFTSSQESSLAKAPCSIRCLAHRAPGRDHNGQHEFFNSQSSHRLPAAVCLPLPAVCWQLVWWFALIKYPCGENCLMRAIMSKRNKMEMCKK